MVERRVASWSLLGDLARHHRHWQTRLTVIHHLDQFAQGNGLQVPSVAYPRYGARPIEGKPTSVDKAAGREIHFSDLRITHLAKLLELKPGVSPLGFEAWQQYFDAAPEAGDPLPDAARRALSENRAMTWARLRLTLAALASKEEDLFKRHDEFAKAVAALSSVVPPGLVDKPPV